MNMPATLSTATSGVTATIEMLDEMLANDELDVCAATTQRGLKLFSLHLNLGPERECGRPAVAMVTITCVRDGVDSYSTCRRHLKVLQSMVGKARFHLCCGVCGGEALYITST